MLYAGMDVHKKFCQIIVCTKEGEIIRKGNKRILLWTKECKSSYRSIYKL